MILNLLRDLRQGGFRVREAWATPGLEPSPEEWICPLWVRWDGDDKPPPARTAHAPSLLRACLGLLRGRPHVVNVHYVSQAAYYFALLKDVFGYRLVLSAHGSDLLKPWPIDAAHLPRLLEKADMITVVSENLRDKVRSYAPVASEKIRVIPNGIDCDFWAPSAEGRGRPGSGPVIAAVGRLEPVKGFDVLIEAFSIVSSRIPGARLCILGDGSSRDELARQARRFGVADAVEFAGSVPPEEIRERLRASDVFVLSSRSEGMPLAILEAMATGLPAVATRVGGVPEVVEGSGVLVSPEAPDELADALLGILTDEELAGQLAAASRKRALSYSSKASFAAYTQVYRDVLKT